MRRRAVHRHQVKHPWGRIALRARTPSTENGVPLVQCLRLHEEIAECRRLGIARRRREHDFGIGGDFDGSPRPCTIGDAHAAQLDIVFGRYRYLGMGVEVVIAATKFDAPFGKNHLVALRRFQSGLVSGRPEFTGGHIA